MPRTTEKLSFTLRVGHNYEANRKRIETIRKELNFAELIGDSIRELQISQREMAPIGKGRQGPHGRIPRSIKPARRPNPAGNPTGRNGALRWTSVSKTNYGPAIFTNEGTGLGAKPPRVKGYPGLVRPSNKAYFIKQPTQAGGFWHPGVGGKPGGYAKLGWWGFAFERNSSLLMEKFRSKVERVLESKIG